MKKNIWIMNHYASDTFFDHGGRHYYFAKYLALKGYEPIIFCCNAIHGKNALYFNTNNLWEEHKLDEINTPYIFVKARTYLGNGKQRILNMVDFYVNVIKSAKQYAKIQGNPDVIYASSVHPLTLLAGIKLAKYFGIKCICEIRDLWPESLVAYGLLKKDSLISKILYAGEKKIYKKADKIIMTWPGGYDYINEKKWDKEISSNKVVYISNGVDLETYQRNINNQKFEDSDLNKNDIRKFVYTGSLRLVNNVKLLIDAAEILQQNNIKAMILIWGDGDEFNNLKNLITEKKLNNIKLKGKVKKTFIPSILSQCDVSVLHNKSTSLDKYGQSQNKFFEYLAAGHPILMTYTVGHSVCSEYNCGIELKEQTAESIANGIEYYVKMNDKDFNIQCDNARNISKTFDFAKLTDVLIKTIETL